MPTLPDILNSKIGKGGKSKAYVASKLGVSERTIENYMKGARSPKPDAIIKLSEILGFSLAELSANNGMTTYSNIPNFETKKVSESEKDKTIEILKLHIQDLKDQVEFLKSLITDKKEKR